MGNSADAAYLAGRKLWGQLSRGPWVCDERGYTDPLQEEIVELTGREIPGSPGVKFKDYASAMVRVRQLRDFGFLTVERLDSRTVRYTKAKRCPEPPGRGDWVAEANREIQRQVQAEQAQHAAELRTAEEHRRFFEGPSQAEQIRELVEQQVAERIKPLGERLLGLELAVHELTAAVAATNDKAGVGPRRRHRVG